MLGVVLSGLGAGRVRRTPLLAALAAVLAVAAAVGLLTVPVPTTGAAAPAAVTAALPDRTGVQALLDAHADALRRRDRDAYAAGLDPSPAATQYRASALAGCDHADGVPLASYALRYDRPVTSGVSLQTVRDRFGAGAGIVRVDLEYAFTGVDARPTRHTQYLTVVPHADGWTIAGDDDLAAEGGSSWHAPWDFGPLVVATARSGLVLVHPTGDDVAATAAAQQTAAGLATALDAAVTAVNAHWGTGWPQRVAVVVAGRQAEMDAIAGPGYPLDTVLAVAAPEPTTAVTEGPDVAAGQRVVLSGATLPGLDAAARADLLRHELTHVATRAVTVSGMPTWLVEGFADYVAHVDSATRPRQIAADLSRAVASAGVPTALPADSAFAPASDTGGAPGTGDRGVAGSGVAAVAAAYEQAWYAVRTLALLGGPAAPAAFYRDVADRVLQGASAAAAVDAALRTTARTDTAGFVARWRALMGSELAP